MTALLAGLAAGALILLLGLALGAYAATLERCEDLRQDVHDAGGPLAYLGGRSPPGRSPP
jgi:hypothetical protein